MLVHETRLEGEIVGIDDLYAEYRKNFDEKIFSGLYSQCKKYCMFIYKKERKRFWNVPEEKALEVMENQILFCRDRCLKEEVECFRRCLGSYFVWRMKNEVERQEKEEKLVYASELKTLLGLDQSNISDDEAISRVRDDRANTREENIYSDLVRWHDIKTYLKEIDQLEAKVFLMSFHLSNREISKTFGKSENQIAKIKCKVKKYLMEKFFSEKE
jgi:hypothetical protein